MQEFHIVAETPAGSGNYTETGEVITTSVDDAVARCVTLSAGGSNHGVWVYESVGATQLLPPGGIGVADDTGGGSRSLERRTTLPADTPGHKPVPEPIPEPKV